MTVLQVAAFDRVVEALRASNAVANESDDSCVALCPAHDDMNPSLSVTRSDTRALLKCHAGCDTPQVVEALDLRMSDLFDDTAPPDPLPDTEAEEPIEYVYTDASGDPITRVTRLSGKRFIQSHWNGDAWLTGLKGSGRVLFNLPAVHAAVAEGTWVFVVEGEKDAERLAQTGWPATTISGGANFSNWAATDTEILDSASVIVIGDNDPPGQKYARFVADDLVLRGATVRLVRLPGVVEKGDVSDWLDDGHSLEQLAELVDSTPNWTPRREFGGAAPTSSAGQIRAFMADDLRAWAREPIQWRVQGVMVTDTRLVAGASKKTLKTTLVSAEMAFAIANGTPWLGHPDFEVPEPTPVVVVINEGLRSYVRTLTRIPQRLERDSVGPIIVVEASAARIGDQDLDQVIADAVTRTDAGLVIYDAWYGFVGGETDASSLFSMAEVLKALQVTNSNLGVDSIVVHHLKKNSKGRPDLDDLSYAGIAEWADSWLLMTHRSTPEPDEGRFYLGVVAGSRQWGELDYELDGQLGAVNVSDGGYSEAPMWSVRSVNSAESKKWSAKSKPAASSEALIPRIEAHIRDHPYEFTKSQIEKEFGGGQAARKALRQLEAKETVRQIELRRQEGNRDVKRPLWGPSDVDPPSSQPTLTPI